MGWFEGQIKQRMEYDDDAFQEAFVKMAGAVMGEKVTAALENDRQQAQNAMDEILKFYHVQAGKGMVQRCHGTVSCRVAGYETHCSPDSDGIRLSLFGCGHRQMDAGESQERRLF